MPLYRITPYEMTADFLQRRGYRASLGDVVIGEIHDYNPRAYLQAPFMTEELACNMVWTMYQNVDEDQRTIDVGRSLMCGDLLQVTDVEDNTSSIYHISLIGFDKLDEIQTAKFLIAQAMAET